MTPNGASFVSPPRVAVTLLRRGVRRPGYAPWMFTFNAETAAAIIAREDALHTLADHTIEDVLAAIDDRDAIEDEQDAFHALMGAMFELRPKGFV